MSNSTSNLDYSEFTDIERERLTLCACMKGHVGYERVMSMLLKPIHFSDPRHKIIFEAIKNAYSKSQKVTALELLDELEIMGKADSIGGLPYVLEVSGVTTSAANAESDAGKVKELAIKRGLLGYWNVVVEGLSDKSKSSTDIISDGIDFLSKAGEASKRSKIYTMKELVQIGKEDIADKLNQRAKGKGLTTGYSGIDRKIGGLRSMLVEVAGLPSMGKTDMILNFARKMADKDIPVGIISAEMNEAEMIDRVWGLKLDINRSNITNATLNEFEDNAIYKDEEVAKMPIYMDFTSKPTANSIRVKLMSMKAKYGIRAAFIDHMQVMGWHTNHKSENANWREIPRALKNIARDLDIPVILAAQLSRDVARARREPILADLREAGEEDADVVLMLHREDYQSDSKQSELVVFIRKARGGQTGKIVCGYDKETGIIGETETNPNTIKNAPEPEHHTDRADTGHGDEDAYPF